MSGLGVFAAAATCLGEAIWFHHHWAFTLDQTVFCVPAWLLAGVVMGVIICPSHQHALASKPHDHAIAD